MKKILGILVSLIGLVFLLNGCGAAKVSPEVAKTFNEKTTLYTTRNMHYNPSRGHQVVETTNFQIGLLIPVNSQVTMDSISRNSIVFIYNEKKIILKNTPKYSGLDINGVAEQYFAKTKVNLKKFSKSERKAIKFAQTFKGMRKSAVLISLGTPPVHQTQSLEMNQWKYWKTRWSTFLISFNKGKVTNP
jgi:hypothetical protein